MDQIEGVRASNPGRPKRIGRSGARGGGGTRRSGSFRGGAAQGGRRGWEISRYRDLIGPGFGRGAPPWHE